jgi:predicted Zn-dependent protease
MKALLGEMAARLGPKTARPDEVYTVEILDSPEANAFALPSGRLYLTRGLLALANDSAEIAAVMAHEIAHVSQRHASARSELEARSALLTRVVADVLSDGEGAAALRDRSRASLAGFSRAQEFEADAIGIRTVAAAGYDPRGAARFLAALERNAQAGRSAGQDSKDMFASHPGTAERVNVARDLARRLRPGASGETGRDAYLAALEGFAYGDNPADGQVRGRRFLHPRLGVAFEAPDGIALKNTPRAVLGASADGRRRLLFDAIEAPVAKPLGDVLAESWIPALEVGSARTVESADRTVAVAASDDDGWRFRLGALRLGETVFRVILAERSPAQPSLDRDFAAALDTVRELGREEAQSVRSRRIALVTATAADTVESLSSRMATERPSERFLALNGLERGAALVRGARYKLVVD